MKNILAFLCLLLVQTIVQGDIVDSYLELSKDALTTCAKEQGLTAQNPREIYDKDATTGVDGASCLRSCMLKSMNVMKDMKINQDKAIEIVKKANADQPEKIVALQKAVAECAEKAQSLTDECKMAYSYIECFLDKH